MRKRFPPLFLVGLAFSMGFIALGFLLASPAEIFRGLFTILTEQDLLITDYFYLAGIGPALVNAGLVTLASILLIQLSGDAYNGFTLVELSLMAGFALFGKNLLNITPILLGTWCYAKYPREPFSKYVGVGLLSTALSPLISFLAFGSIHASLPLAFAAGMLLGFLLPPLSAYTYKIQNGMNLYNMGFACGLLAMMIVPALDSFLALPPALEGRGSCLGKPPCVSEIRTPLSAKRSAKSCSSRVRSESVISCSTVSASAIVRLSCSTVTSVTRASVSSTRSPMGGAKPSNNSKNGILCAILSLLSYSFSISSSRASSSFSCATLYNTSP